jgi:hypothetical protein
MPGVGPFPAVVFDTPEVAGVVEDCNADDADDVDTGVDADVLFHAMMLGLSS